MKIGSHVNALEAFSAAYDEYSDAIFRHCYFLTFNRERAMDFAQEAFMKTWEYIADGHDIDNPRAFLYKVATNLIYSAARKKKEVSLEALQEVGFDPPSEDPELARDYIEEQRVLKTLRAIDEPYRSAVIMRHIEGHSVSEMTEMTGESANVLSVRIHRGLQQLRSRLKHA